MMITMRESFNLRERERERLILFEKETNKHHIVQQPWRDLSRSSVDEEVKKDEIKTSPHNENLIRFNK